jgi:hypothetical protein
MEKSRSNNVEEAEAAAEKCSQIILKLWDQKVKNQIIDIKRKVRDINFMILEDNDDFYQTIRDAVENSEKIKSGELNIENGINLLSLSEVENWLIELLWLSEVIINQDAEILDEAVRILVKSEEETQKIRKKVSKVFPGLENIDLPIRDETQEQIKEALRAIDRIRRKIIRE